MDACSLHPLAPPLARPDPSSSSPTSLELTANSFLLPCPRGGFPPKFFVAVAKATKNPAVLDFRRIQEGGGKSGTLPPAGTLLSGRPPFLDAFASARSPVLGLQGAQTLGGWSLSASVAHPSPPTNLQPPNFSLLCQTSAPPRRTLTPLGWALRESIVFLNSVGSGHIPKWGDREKGI